MTMVLESTRTLDELAASINEGHSEVLAHIGAALQRAITIGEALIEAKRLVPYGQWEMWLNEHVTLAHSVCRDYVRIATHQTLIPPHIQGPAAAKIYLRDLPGSSGTRNTEIPDEVILTVKRLRSTGLSERKVAALTGVSKNTVARATAQPGTVRYDEGRAREQRRADKRTQAILQRRRRDRGMAAIGGDWQEAYLGLRTATSAMVRAYAASDDPERQQALKAAMSRVRYAEDAIANIIGVG